MGIPRQVSGNTEQTSVHLFGWWDWFGQDNSNSPVVRGLCKKDGQENCVLYPTSSSGRNVGCSTCLRRNGCQFGSRSGLFHSFWRLYISTFYWPRFTFLPNFTELHLLFAVIENWASALFLDLDSYLISQNSISNSLHRYIRAEIVQPKWYQASHPSPLLSHWSRLSFFPFVKGSFPLYRCPVRLAPPGMRVTTNIFSQRLLPSQSLIKLDQGAVGGFSKMLKYSKGVLQGPLRPLKSHNLFYGNPGN